MNAPDVPDLLDRGPRLRRLATSLCVAVAVGALVGWGAYLLARPDVVASASVSPSSGPAGAWRFVFYMATLAGCLAGALTHVLLRRRDRARERHPPRATATFR